MFRVFRPCLHSNRFRQITMATALSSRAKVAVCQMRATDDKAKNFGICKSLIAEAKEGGAKMVFLPECFDFIASSGDASKLSAETMDGTTMTKYRQLAKQKQIWLSLGGFHRKPDGDKPDDRFYNSHILIDDQGQVQGQYDKIHLFDVTLPEVKLQETAYTIPGGEVEEPVATPVGMVGMAICYDLRFPEMARRLCDLGADVITFPSAFTVPTGQAHWHALLRARAIENQCYVVAAAQMGEHNDRRTSYGHALIVDPWGEVVAECTQETEVRLAEIDLERLNEIRRKLPVRQHRRPDVFGYLGTLTEKRAEQDSYQFGHVTIDKDCVFCTTGSSYAFVNVKPVVPGHCLISPIEPVEKLADLRPEQTADLFITVQKVVSVVQKVYQTDSVTVGVQDGPASGQTIKHVHVHVLPRKPGDFTKNDDIYDKLEHHDADMTSSNSRLRTREEMSAEAAMMRKHFL